MRREPTGAARLGRKGADRRGDRSTTLTFGDLLWAIGAAAVTFAVFFAPPVV